MNLVAIHLDETSLVSLMQTANSMQSQLLNDDLWLTRITVLTSLYPGAAHLERGAEESAYAWHRRYRRALVSASLMAEQNMRGDMPYMRMHGEFQSARFIAHTPLRLPAPYGLIAEVVRYAVRSISAIILCVSHGRRSSPRRPRLSRPVMPKSRRWFRVMLTCI